VHLTRLYWYTVEFGLIRQDDGLRIYGSGIVSSKGESIYSLESGAPNRIGFDLERIMRTRYRIDTDQKTYFVIDSFEQLMESTRPDFLPIYDRLSKLDSIPAGDVLDGDKGYNRGPGQGWLQDGAVRPPGARPRAWRRSSQMLAATATSTGTNHPARYAALPATSGTSRGSPSTRNATWVAAPLPTIAA